VREGGGQGRRDRTAAVWDGGRSAGGRACQGCVLELSAQQLAYVGLESIVSTPNRLWFECEVAP